MHDLVKRAGKNVLLSVGKLMETQSELLKNDRERVDAIVTDAAKEYITRIAITVPENYTVSESSLEKLGRFVRNDAGEFVITSKFADGKLTIELLRRFGRRFLSADVWPDMVELLDAVSSWHGVTLLIEKIG